MRFQILWNNSCAGAYLVLYDGYPLGRQFVFYTAIKNNLFFSLQIPLLRNKTTDAILKLRKQALIDLNRQPWLTNNKVLTYFANHKGA